MVEERRPFRERHRTPLTALSGVWSSFWVLVALVGPGAEDPATLAERIGVGLFAVAVAAVPWVWLRRRATGTGRPTRAQRRDAKRLKALQRLPEDAREAWVNLDQAQGLLFELAARGWVDNKAVFSLAEETDRLRDLLEVDAQTDQVGGAPSTNLRDRVIQLRDLVVALCDEAVEHQTEQGGTVLPVTLQDAHDRMRAEGEARRMVDGIG